MPDRIGVAFVGCTHPHIVYRLKLLQAVPDVDIVGCYDPDKEICHQLEQHYGLRTFPSAEALLDHPEVKLTIIEGWDTDNPAYTRLAVARKQAILLEKPGAPDLPGMQALSRDIRGQSLPFQIAYQLRYSPVIERVRHILDSGVLGPITLGRFHAAAPVGAAREPWQSVPGDLGGVVYTDGCHMVDLIILLLGLPQQVTGRLLKLPEGESVLAYGYKKDTFAGPGATCQIPLGGLMYEDAGAAILDYGDKLVTLDITGWEAHPWVESWRIELFGTNGSLYAGPQPPWYRLYIRTPQDGYNQGWHSWKGSHLVDGGKTPTVNVNYTREMEHMLARVRAWDVDNSEWLADAEAVIMVLDAIFQSSMTGGSIILGSLH